MSACLTYTGELIELAHQLFRELLRFSCQISSELGVQFGLVSESSDLTHLLF